MKFKRMPDGVRCSMTNSFEMKDGCHIFCDIIIEKDEYNFYINSLLYLESKHILHFILPSKEAKQLIRNVKMNNE